SERPWPFWVFHREKLLSLFYVTAAGCSLTAVNAAGFQRLNCNERDNRRVIPVPPTCTWDDLLRKAQLIEANRDVLECCVKLVASRIVEID
ncbi:MAG TPA: hypothetical protein VK440_00760, partial [Burkholderiales bacterium]|nr:hypothetical protein [Burkholderiales bacterium]